MLLGHRQLSDASLKYFIGLFLSLNASLNSSLFILSSPAQYFGSSTKLLATQNYIYFFSLFLIGLHRLNVFEFS